MNDFETQAARRRAELEWQEMARQGEAQRAAAQRIDIEAKDAARRVIDARTARLRGLRLAKEQTVGATEQPAPKRTRARRKT